MSGHSEKEYSIFEIAFNLFMACLISGVIIAGVYYFTEPIAAQKREEMKKESMRSLIPSAKEFMPIEGKKGWFLAKDGNKELGYILPSESKGFGGKIDFLVAVSLDDKVIDYVVLKHNETPGLGDKGGMSPFKDQFKGKSLEQLVVVKDPTNKENINALTGATITSNAITKGVSEAVEKVKTEFPVK